MKEIKDVKNNISRSIPFNFEIEIFDIKINSECNLNYNAVIRTMGNEYYIYLETDMFDVEYSKYNNFKGVYLDMGLFENTEDEKFIIKYLFNGQNKAYEKFICESIYKFHIDNNLPLKLYYSSIVMDRSINSIKDVLYEYDNHVVKCIKNETSIKIVVDGTELSIEIEGYLNEDTNEYWIGECYFEDRIEKFDYDVNLFLLGRYVL